MPGAPTPSIELPLPCAPPPIPPVAVPARRRRPSNLAPGARIGAWRIERELGRGGMATVYSVVHTRFGKRAALKLVHDGILGPQFTRETFLREARIANLVDHPGVTEVFATGSFAGRPYLAMERLRGRSLDALLAAAPLPRDTALDILLELCDVLGAAHAAGVVHGDLKLENVFVLDEPGARGRRTKLLDWGIARIAGEDDPLRGIIAGTLTYVAPEQIRCDELTPAADLYALGVLAYRLLLGEPPFRADSDLDLIRKHLCGVPPQPRTRWAAIPGKLEAILLAMLAKQPNLRPTLAEVTDVLRAVRRRVRPPRRWLALRTRPAADVIGRPILATLPGRSQQVAGAALCVALVIASLLQLLSA
ncbi:MAG TPA: serine/threonine-protein kinase [Kofleriaceae bacterium]|jgi:serine/threonine-protein kinase|nr:serine/threonine-protein kinase [Kofleriaceae bacterium]